MPVVPVTMVLILMRRPRVEYYLSIVYPAVHMREYLEIAESLRAA
jgi:hypothetical protein